MPPCLNYNILIWNYMLRKFTGVSKRTIFLIPSLRSKNSRQLFPSWFEIGLLLLSPINFRMGWLWWNELGWGQIVRTIIFFVFITLGRGPFWEWSLLSSNSQGRVVKKDPKVTYYKQCGFTMPGTGTRKTAPSLKQWKFNTPGFRFRLGQIREYCT